MVGTGRVVLITGGANGIGRATARRLAASGAQLVIADVDASAGEAVAAEVNGTFVPCDVTDPDQNQAAVDHAVSEHGRLDVAFLNAGLALGSDLGEGFDLDAYRRAMAVNLDGVVFGIHAALSAFRVRRRGSLVLTASLAGLTAAPTDPVYCANKHAVVGLARSLGPILQRDHVTVNAVCPGFTDTDIIRDIRGVISEAEIPLLDADDVARAVCDILDSGATGEAWYVQPGRPAAPFRFPNLPGPRNEAGERVGAVPSTPSTPGAPG